MQHKPERGRRMCAFDQVKADGPHRLPHGKIIGADRLVIPLFRGIELSVKMPVYMEGVVGTDGSFFQEKRVEVLAAKKPAHKMFDIGYFQCDHNNLRLICSVA